MFKLKFLLFFTTLLSITVVSNAQSWVTDNQMNFKINVPYNWTKSDHIDGTDKVYDFYSSDQNLAIQLRAFDAPSNLTLDLLINVYENQMLPSGATMEALEDRVSKNGISGKQGTYLFNYNGNNVAMGVFYAIVENKGYVLNAMIPKNLLEQRFSEMKAITESFTLLSSPTNQNKGIGGLSGHLGSSVNSGNSNSNTGSVPFRVTKITLCDQLDQNNRAVIPKAVFGTKTPEIHASIEYLGHTNNEIVVKWIYHPSNYIISEDTYTFKQGTGNVGVVSLSKPNNDWPVGEYWVEFYEGPSVFKELKFDIK